MKDKIPLNADVIGSPPHTYVWPAVGMSMRDYFAAKAMQGLLSDPEPYDVTRGKTVEQEYAESAYRFADAMLAAREVKS